jgi:hypothetical protein
MSETGPQNPFSLGFYLANFANSAHFANDEDAAAVAAEVSRIYSMSDQAVCRQYGHDPANATGRTTPRCSTQLKLLRELLLTCNMNQAILLLLPPELNNGTLQPGLFLNRSVQLHYFITSISFSRPDSVAQAALVGERGARLWRLWW